MIDSVLKGTGNSRFLKSAVPAGTSWADALAMLQAGTFPIDFNGINAEGFQQVGTPLNKANLLKDATAAQIGLPPSTTPDGMFRALGNTGELHVWRKTITSGTGTTTTYPVSTNPNAYQEGEYGKAGYTLGDVKTGTFQIGQGATTIAANRAIIKYGASVSVTDTGTASIASESELTVTSDSSQAAVDKLKGKFFRFSQLPFSSSAFSVGKIYFFPANTVFTKQSSGNWYASKYQTVTSHGKTEPEYTIEYLGKLGDKARVQVVSYVGTGTYGSSNPNSLTFDFVPKVIIVSGFYNTYSYGMILSPQTGTGVSLLGSDRGYVYKVTCNTNGKIVSWYGGSKGDQLNADGVKYVAVAIG